MGLLYKKGKIPMFQNDGIFQAMDNTDVSTRDYGSRMNYRKDPSGKYIDTDNPREGYDGPTISQSEDFESPEAEQTEMDRREAIHDNPLPLEFQTINAVNLEGKEHKRKDYWKIETNPHISWWEKKKREASLFKTDAIWAALAAAPVGKIMGAGKNLVKQAAGKGFVIPPELLKKLIGNNIPPILAHLPTPVYKGPIRNIRKLMAEYKLNGPVKPKAYTGAAPTVTSEFQSKIEEYATVYIEIALHPSNIEKMKTFDRIFNEGSTLLQEGSRDLKKFNVTDIVQRDLGNANGTYDLFLKHNAANSGLTSMHALENAVEFAVKNPKSDAFKEIAKLLREEVRHRVSIDPASTHSVEEMYNVISHELKHLTNLGNIRLGKKFKRALKEVFHLKKGAHYTYDERSSMEYVLDNTETLSFLGTNLKNYAKRIGLIDHVLQDLPPGTAKELLLVGDFEMFGLTVYKLLDINSGALDKLMKILPYGIAAPIAVEGGLMFNDHK